MKKYDHAKIEKKWQKVWEKTKPFAAVQSSSKSKYYCLIEFPYPSGEGLHVGHPRPYTALDVLARKRRMQGYNVLYPIGFDAFGLPSENYAIKTGIHPSIVTQKNIETFTRQLKSFGCSFDWDREVVTTDPEYYKWTQWIFLKMFEHGLAYKAKMAINWCPKDKIGLANEEVINGHCERCGTPVEKRDKEQWMLAITKYADRLITDLDTVEYLPQIKQQQINWIGRKEWIDISYPIVETADEIIVSTTRPDTNFGATFVVVAPEHPILSTERGVVPEANRAAIDAYITQAKAKSELERIDEKRKKSGVFTGLYCLNRLNGKKLPIYVSDFVLMTVGTGAVVGVPGHDVRDFEFAQAFDLPIIRVVVGTDGDTSPITKRQQVQEEEGRMINSEFLDGLDIHVATKKIMEYLEEKKWGRRETRYHLRDWVFSRQRYWGEPIPMVYCQACKDAGRTEHGWVPLPEKDLPVTLPDVKKYEPTDSGESPLAVMTDWVTTTCPVCGGAAKRETDTMPNWAGSNWYFLRYADPKNRTAFASAEALQYWLPVDWYNGGMEHTTLHLLYSRFVYKFLYDIGAVPKKCGPEPYRKRTSHGLILGGGGEKMSKSRGNVVNPDDVVKAVGADTFRLYEMFMGPFDQAIPWDTQGVSGVRRFVERVWQMYQSKNIQLNTTIDPELKTLVHRTIKKVGDDIETQDYNTAVSAMMILVNAITKAGTMDRQTTEDILKLLSPFAPHIAEELWHGLGHTDTITYEPWPTYDEQLLKVSTFNLIIQVNGKVRDSMSASTDMTADEAEAAARQREKIQKYLEHQMVVNVVFVPGRLINFVVK